MNEDGPSPTTADEPRSTPTEKGTAKAVAAPKKAATKKAAKTTAPSKQTAPTKQTAPRKMAGSQRGPTPKSFPTEKSGSIDGLLAAKEIVIACGPGGVGKTTTAAAAGVMAAVQQGGKVLVLTVDPAKRLADALGLEGIGNTERRVPDEAFRAAGLKPRGELWAAMLDTKQSWDALIRRHAPDEQTRDEIRAKPLY
jgi:hypothetical protein